MNEVVFGESVQSYLRLAGYTQKQLAEKLGLHAKVLSRKLNNSADARLTQQEVRQVIKTLALWRAISTKGEALELLALAQLKASSFSAEEWGTHPLNLLEADPVRPRAENFTAPSASRSRNNLPAPMTRLIGREWAVQRLQQLLKSDDGRVVTLLGPGGSGKTRLAIQVASELVTSFAHGVWFVPLDGVLDYRIVPMSIVQALGIMPTPDVSVLQSLVNYVRDKNLLLVLDNFEQVRKAAPFMGELLAAAPGLKLLLTSRVVLHLYGEREFSVPPLDVPGNNIVLDIAEIRQYSAVRLFLERAQAVAPAFALTNENVATVTRICARLDGLPLALELAAARLKLLPLDLLLERLSEASLPMLTRGASNLPQKQQTLRDAITWSYHLLSEDEQQCFMRMGIFAGSWSLEAGEAVIRTWPGTSAMAPSALDMYGQLVDSSLLVRVPDAGGQARFTMLETIREYALEQLAEQGELEPLLAWHAQYCLQIAEAAEVGLRGREQQTWLARLVAERDNMRTALVWLRRQTLGIPVDGSLPETDAVAINLRYLEVGLRLASALSLYWEWQGYITEGYGWLNALLEIPCGEETGRALLAVRGHALSKIARLSYLQYQMQQAREQASASVALWRQLEDQHGLAAALYHQGWLAHAQSDLTLAKSAFDECLHILPEDCDPWLKAELFYSLGEMAGFASEFPQAHAYLAESSKVFARSGDKRGSTDVLNAQGGITILEGNYAEAIGYLLRAIASGQELGHTKFIAESLAMVGFACGLRGTPDAEAAVIQAARLMGAAESLLASIGVVSWLKTQPTIAALLMWMEMQVGATRWEEAWKAGSGLTMEQALTLAYVVAEEQSVAASN